MSLTKITSLTAAQEALLPSWHERWLRTGMSDAPTDREIATAAIGRAYATVGKRPPLIVFSESPVTSILGIWVWPSFVSITLGDSLGASLRDSLGASPHPIPTTYFWGQHDAYWIAFYLFCQEIGVQYKPEAKEKLKIMADLAESCGWIYFYENVAFVSARPTVRTQAEDRNSRQVELLHCPDLPAMEFKDGWKIYAWHGTRMPADCYEQSVTAQRILSEPNVEVRRALIERYDHFHGKGQFMEDCGATVIDAAQQRMLNGTVAENQLIQVDLADDPEGKMVALRLNDPSTERKYIVRVPPDMRRVTQALAWCANVPEAQYVLAAES